MGKVPEVNRRVLRTCPRVLANYCTKRLALNSSKIITTGEMLNLSNTFFAKVINYITTVFNCLPCTEKNNKNTVP